MNNSLALSSPPSQEPADLPIPLRFGAGLLMGSADAVPGVSGGTIALIIGIYERFINALASVTRSPLLLRKASGRAELKHAFGLLIPLGVGILCAYYVVTRILVKNPGYLLRSDTAPLCYAFFFGLVLFSLREPWRRIVAAQPGHYIALVIGAAASAFFVGLPHSATPATWTLVFGGAGAVAVMLLPGVSGSMLLVIIGQYQVVSSAVHGPDLVVLGLFAVGMLAGIITMVPLLKYLLRARHDYTMAVLTGLMAGSLRALWPWKDNYDLKAGPMNNTTIYGNIVWVVVAAVAGAAVVWFLVQIERRITGTASESSSAR